MLTRLREIVEKVASAPRLNEALNILVTDICLAMDTEVCSVYLADHDRRCYYLMARPQAFRKNSISGILQK